MFRILVVDDQRDVRQLMRAGLETLGLEMSIVDVPSGEEALVVIALQPFDLLITDVRLPGISGLELKQRALQRNPDLKLILITGVTDPKVRRDVSQAGVQAFFYKPIEMADFLDAVERCLGVVDSVTPLPLSTGGVKEAPAQSLSERLVNFRHDLKAISAVLLDERGRVVARAGDLPESTQEAALIPALMATVSAGVKAAHFLGKSPAENLFFFPGTDHDLIVTHVGVSMVLLVFMLASPDRKHLTKTLERVEPAVKDFLEILGKMGVVVQGEEQPMAAAQPEYEPVPEDSQEVAVLEDILHGVADSQFDPDEVDAFWDSLTDSDSQEGVTNADALSWEQARQLGLAPEENE